MLIEVRSLQLKEGPTTRLNVSPHLPLKVKHRALSRTSKHCDVHDGHAVKLSKGADFKTHRGIQAELT